MEVEGILNWGTQARIEGEEKERRVIERKKTWLRGETQATPEMKCGKKEKAFFDVVCGFHFILFRHATFFSAKTGN